MEHPIITEFEDKLAKYPLIHQYLGRSLCERSKTEDWFENRLIRAILLDKPDKSWIRDKENALENARIKHVVNGEDIFSDLHGTDVNYDMKLFDCLAEISVIIWARKNGYTHIEKIVKDSSGLKTPDFIIGQKESMILAEAKHFRERDYLFDFVYDRIAGLLLATKYYKKIGLKIETTEKYEEVRDTLVKEKAAMRSQRTLAARIELQRDILAPLANREINQLKVIGQLFHIVPTKIVGSVETSTMGSRDPTSTCTLMLDKITGKTCESLDQISAYCDRQANNQDICEARVFLSGTDRRGEEWDTMWDVLCGFNDKNAWAQVRNLYETAQQKIGIPFNLMVEHDSSEDFIIFPHYYEEGKHFNNSSLKALE